MKKGIRPEDISLFDLTTSRPDDTKLVSYEKFGPTFGKKNFYKFIDEAKKSMNVNLDKQVYSYMIIEGSIVDGKTYYELSLNENIFLPIAGRQLSIIKRHATANDMSLEGFVESINFILNDSRVYE